ncbi:WecB/TagA/CpsF family glycosyltransferase [Candidatus Daviesbacteria bacterium]|nr:WecB/TagA/CpsF family glycosyltransferase [Candidatus Daviesbacteria bacterium]
MIKLNKLKLWRWWKSGFFSHWFLKRNRLVRLLLWPLFFLPLKQLIPFERVSGTDFLEALCKLASEKGFTTGFLGGKGEVAKKVAECLQKKYPKLKVEFAESGGEVDKYGANVILSEAKDLKIKKRESRDSSLIVQNDKNELSNIPPTDILFVAFGHIKQEKWIARNLEKTPAHVMMGVGGAFDYLSGNVPRAPKWVRNLGFEWFYRLIIQPWRIKRQLALLQYLWLILKG